MREETGMCMGADQIDEANGVRTSAPWPGRRLLASAGQRRGRRPGATPWARSPLADFSDRGSAYNRESQVKIQEVQDVIRPDNYNTAESCSFGN
jgi:hypothetical protein